MNGVDLANEATIQGGTPSCLELPRIAEV